MVATAVALLFDRSGSAESDETRPLPRAKELAASGSTLIVMSGAAPRTSVGRVQLTKACATLHCQPSPIGSLTTVAPGGTSKVTVRLSAVLGPALFVARMKVIGWPLFTVLGRSEEHTSEL